MKAALPRKVITRSGCLANGVVGWGKWAIPSRCICCVVTKAVTFVWLIQNCICMKAGYCFNACKACKIFQKALDQMGETFILDVPNDFRIYTYDPKPYLLTPSKKGRSPMRYKTDLVSLKAKQWVKQQGTKTFRRYAFRDGTKGAMEVEAIHQRVWGAVSPNKVLAFPDSPG